MIDWHESMNHTYEYYIVDPLTWKDDKKIDIVKSSTIKRDSTVETLGSASFEVTDLVGECYIRTYLIASQNGISEKVCLGTHLVQSPSSSFDGKIKSVSLDAYTSLIELKENQPPLGYSLLKDDPIMYKAYMIAREQVRAPVVPAVNDKKLNKDFVSNTDDTWLSFDSDLISNAKYEFSLDELGRILFSPKQELSSLQPTWTYNDDNSSILYPDVSMDHDIYGIPNVVEVIYSNGSDSYYARVVNDDINSPTSSINRGREIVHRVTDWNLSGTPTYAQVQEYAESLLKELSSVEYTVTYTHGYCPVRLGDCVRLNYSRAGLNNIKAKVISQSIKCESGCSVEEKAKYTVKLWR